jgi:hypothetical protein
VLRIARKYKIVAAAADQIKRTGIAEASLADVMAAAGLTHGGQKRGGDKN